MTDRGDGPENKKGNTDKRHEPKDVRHENRLARGDSGMPGPGGHKFSFQAQNLYLKDHGRRQGKVQQQQRSRASGRSDAERGAERSNLKLGEKSPFLDNDFKDAKSRTNDAPAEKTRDDPSRGRDR
mgnify:CR=1 FL=1